MKNVLFLSLTTFLFVTSAFANIGVSFDLLSPVGTTLSDERNEFESDLRIDYGFKDKWSIGAQFNFIKSSEEDSSSNSLSVPANEAPKFHQVRDRNLLIFGRWYKSGFSNSSLYFGLGAGLANREFSIYEDGKNTRESSSGTIYSGQFGYQWMLATATGVSFELNFSQSSVDENTVGFGTGYTYDYKKDRERIQPKILFTHRF
jgi:hypothetical protein